MRRGNIQQRKGIKYIRMRGRDVERGEEGKGGTEGEGERSRR